jgi:putative hydrolase of the HAD superfamily
MSQPTRITTLFLDIGGVLLTNGWDRKARARAAQQFQLDLEELNERHHLTFDTYEVGKLSLDQYLSRIVFYEPRSFTREDFRDFMFAQSAALADTIALVRQVKEQNQLRVAAVSNEGRELTQYRIAAFRLGEFIDFFISSCFVHFRKPDEEIFRLALDIAHAQPSEVAYIDDRPMFVDVASGLGIHGIHHQSTEATRAALQACGLRC